jgi:hypothetical protein
MVMPAGAIWEQQSHDSAAQLCTLQLAVTWQRVVCLRARRAVSGLEQTEADWWGPANRCCAPFG